MNREEALKFIRDNSRLIKSVEINPLPKNHREKDYDPNYWEQRIGDNGTIFMLNDFGKNGWELYFLAGSINIQFNIEMFCNRTGCKNPE